MSKYLYLSYDGDGCGKKVGRAIIANDEAALHEISAKIDLGHQIVNHWVAEQGGKVISGGGDEGSFKIPEEAEDKVEELRKDHEFATGITISIGIGESLSEAGRSLLAAKFRGKDQIARYSKDVEKDINKARKRVKKGKATQEEYKLAEAYLEKAENNMAQEQDCQYCEQTDGVDSDHCKYCHDADQAENQDDCPYCADSAEGAVEADCPYCAESPENADDCAYCKDDAASGPKEPEIAAMDDHAAQQNTPIQSPDSNNSSAPAGSAEEKAQADQMGMNPPIIGKPELGNNSSPSGIGEAGIAMDTAGAPVEPANAEASELDSQSGVIPEEDAHSKEAMIAIAERIEGETVDGKPDDKEVAAQIDDTQVVGDNTEGNTSRPENFASNIPGDMGLDDGHASDDESGQPDFSSVLKESLDNQADQIKRQKVVQVVGQALQGFKASKGVLEQSRESAPELYAASIAMLRAMIEMADMLGLGSSGSEDSAGPIDAQAEEVIGEQGDEWNDPFPTHPDHGGERKPGHAAGQGDAADAPQQ